MYQKIFCCACDRNVTARLTNGSEVYSHRADLKEVPFWICDDCNNFVGCHYKTVNKTVPLGCIATDEIKQIRKKIHAVLDPIWKSGKISRKALYRKVSDQIGYNFHAALIRNAKEGERIYQIVKWLD